MADDAEMHVAVSHPSTHRALVASVNLLCVVGLAGCTSPPDSFDIIVANQTGADLSGRLDSYELDYSDSPPPTTAQVMAVTFQAAPGNHTVAHDAVKPGLYEFKTHIGSFDAATKISFNQLGVDYLESLRIIVDGQHAVICGVEAHPGPTRNLSQPPQGICAR